LIGNEDGESKPSLARHGKETLNREREVNTENTVLLE
jgi:hypothetical protein